MDPNEVLKTIRDEANRLLAIDSADRVTNEDLAEAYQRGVQLALSFQALDEWLRNGGFNPWPPHASDAE